jgi:hypothetical protein
MPKGRQGQARKAQMGPCSHQVRSAGPAHLKLAPIEGRELLVATYFPKQHAVYMGYFSGVLIEKSVAASWRFQKCSRRLDPEVVRKVRWNF